MFDFGLFLVHHEEFESPTFGSVDQRIIRPDNENRFPEIPGKPISKNTAPHLRMLKYYSIFLLFCQTFLYGFKKVFFLFR